MSDSPNGRKVIVRGSDEEAAAFVAELFKAIVCEAVGMHGVCYVTLAGGTTPRTLYGMLAAGAVSGEVPWDKLEVFFGDERDVPHDHVESNFHMVQRVLLDHLPVPVSHVHPMHAHGPDPDASAAEYEQSIRDKVPSDSRGMPRFDLILLGMGADGHVASLFPSCECVEERKKLVLNCFVPVLGRKRMTFTLPLINAARNVILLVTGRDKAGAVAALLGDDREARKDLPAAGVEPADGSLFMVLDAAAASRAGPVTG